MLQMQSIHQSMAIVQADGMKHFDGQQNVMPEPNTNLMAPRTLIPTLTARIDKGETVLVSAVFGTKTAGRDAWENPPTEVLTYGKMD